MWVVFCDVGGHDPVLRAGPKLLRAVAGSLVVESQ